MPSKPQLFIIHGGMTFKNKGDYLNFLKTREVSIKARVRWSDEYLTKKLGKEFEIIKPRMPLQDNAKFIIYESKNGHFDIPEFPEIIKMIKLDVKRK